MQIGSQNITREDMPSFISGQDYPLRLYQMKQERLAARLNTQAVPMQQMNSVPSVETGKAEATQGQ